MQTWQCDYDTLRNMICKCLDDQVTEKKLVTVADVNGLINPHLDFPGTFASCSDRYKCELASTRYDVLMYQWDKEFL